MKVYSFGSKALDVSIVIGVKIWLVLRRPYFKHFLYLARATTDPVSKLSMEVCDGIDPVSRLSMEVCDGTDPVSRLSMEVCDVTKVLG